MAGRLAKPRLHVRALRGRPSLSSLAGRQGGIAHTHTQEKKAISMLTTAIDRWVGAKTVARHRVIKGLHAFAREFPSFSVASACSGSDIYAHCL